ncbi:MAG: tetratricopeptide repeat protein [bacterium]|nr:tetratricopeptide repeat protein [bacterium]
MTNGLRFRLQILLILFFLLGTGIIDTTVQGDNRETESKIKEAASWNAKGIEYFKKQDYAAAIECLKKAIGLNPAKVVYFITW